VTDIRQKELKKALENCASEPIHQIGSIQPHGAALVLDSTNDYKVVQTSENIGNFIGISHDVILGNTLATLVDEASFNRVIAMIKVAEKHNVAVGKLNFDCKNVWQEFNVHLYKSNRLYVLEFVIDDEENFDNAKVAIQLLEMQKSQFLTDSVASITEYLNQITRFVREATGYDSVMVYRFNSDWNGEVICQSHAENCPSYLGTHFPASDIPAQARRLYTINSVRMLADIDAIPVAITPVFNQTTGEALDMSYSALRSLSPIHIEYLRNIGVQASMCISLLQNGRLWGLIICHHKSPKRVSIAMREAAIFISKLASEKITFIAAMEHQIFIHKATKLSEALHERLTESSIELIFQDMLPKIKALLNATGVVAVIHGEKYFCGNVPTVLETESLLEWLEQKSSEKLFSCNHLEEIYEPASNYADIVSGLLAVKLSENMKNCIVWFRARKKETIQWAGKYEDGFTQNAVGEFRLRPRKGFDLWTEEWHGRSKPWSPIENGVAVAIANSISNFSLQKIQGIQGSEAQMSLVAINKKNKENLDKLTLQVPGALYQFKLLPDGQACFPYASNGLNDIFEVMPHQVFTDASAVFAVVHPDDYDMVVKSIQKSAENLETWKLEYRVNLPKKGLRWLSGTASPERLDDGSTIWHGFISDITTLKETLAFQNAEKERQANELIQSYERNMVLSRQVNHMQKLESIGRLTSGIAHDFNNILACMTGYNEMNQDVANDITNAVLKAELEHNTEQIHLAGKRAMDLINKMLTYCRQEIVEKEINIKPTQEIIHEVLSMLRPALTNRIKIEYLNLCHINYDDCGTCVKRDSCETDIEIDAIDLHQILTNLAVNARDAMKEHSGTITFALNTVTNIKTICLACSAILDGDFVELSVGDNGAGIESKITHRLFDPFFTTKPQGEGTGLGLSTVSGLVHKSGGHILVDSSQNELNHGTTFRLLFPPILTEYR
jgi:light-regulated signal transduction histidine kinase (bacteriophytochrome)